MKRPIPTALVWGLAALSAGCGPALADLVADKHYREAVCAVSDRAGEDHDLVGRALDADLDPVVHVHVVTDAELRAALGDAAATVGARATLVRVVVATQILPLDELVLDVSLKASDGSAAPASRAALAWAADERLPAQHQEETYATPMNALRLIGGVLTAGLLWAVSPMRRERVWVDAPYEEFLRVAPISTKLDGALRERGCTALDATQGRGYRCEQFFVLERGSTASLELAMEARIGARKWGPNGEEEPTNVCRMTREWKLGLGPSARIGETAAKTFGGEGKALSALRRRPISP